MLSHLKQSLRRVTPQPIKDFYRLFRPRSMREAFAEVYARDDWEGGSGRGSTASNTVAYRQLLTDLLREHSIQSVVDVGCGDWQFSQLIDWSGIDYLGLDTVPAVVEANRRLFGSIARFECRDVTREHLPPADLVILKDVLQHWPTQAIQAFLPRLSQYRFAIITNSIDDGPRLNCDIAMSGYRGLDLRLAPFNWPAEELLRYQTDESKSGELNKLVLLVSADRPDGQSV
jgi:SAM-dependent methyltransferase